MTPAHIVERNRKNAQKSTGPTSDRGKAVARRNSLRHGQSGKGVCLPPDIEAGKQAHLAALTDSIQPADGAEALLVEQMALAAARIDACARQECAAAARRREEALERHDRRRTEAAAFGDNLLETDPARAVEILLRSADGCDTLSDHWDGLVDALDRDRHWTSAELSFAIRLCGLDPAAPDVTVDPLVRAMLVDAHPLMPPACPDAPARRERLRQLAAGERDRLLARADELWESDEAPARAEAAARVLVGTDDESVRLRQYESAHTSSLHRALRGLIALRKLPAQNEPSTQHPATQHPIPAPPTQTGPAVENEPSAAARTENEPSAARRPLPPVVCVENEPSAAPSRTSHPAPIDAGAPHAA